jgi:hypothetical protein
MVDGYKIVEDRVWAAVAEHFFLFEELDESVKIADMRTLFTEQRDLMGTPPKPWDDIVEPYPETIIPLSPKDAKKLFMARYQQLSLRRDDEIRNAFINGATERRQ